MHTNFVMHSKPIWLKLSEIYGNVNQFGSNWSEAFGELCAHVHPSACVHPFACACT